MPQGHLWHNSVFVVQVEEDHLQGAVDCNLTAAYCATQEGNTTGCISSNDGLGAGVEVSFSTDENAGGGLILGSFDGLRLNQLL
jgi:hypothetical protein